MIPEEFVGWHTAEFEEKSRTIGKSQDDRVREIKMDFILSGDHRLQAGRVLEDDLIHPTIRAVQRFSW